MKIIDLTHLLNGDIPTWNGTCGFHSEIKMDYPKGCRVQQYKMHAGVGTHMDAPSHFYKDGKHIADMPLEQLIVPGHVIDVTKRRAPDLLISPADLKAYEEKHGKIEKNSLVIGYTGWGAFWNDTTRYRNADAKGKMHFPGFSKKAAEFLLERDIAGLGIDTLSPDGSNHGFPVHELILGAGKYILENLTNLDKLPPKGALCLALPIKVDQGTEAAVRAVALLSATFPTVK